MLQEKILKKRNANDDKLAIAVKNVNKEFIIPHERRTTIFENIRGAFSPSTYEKFVALQDVSFTVNRGESIGIIGDNGSGKSTLLKIISRILRPTRGSVEVNGKITPFLELGVGFQPDLTARENIELYSTIMGLSDKEISKNMDSVLAFAGLEKFRDTKLKNFSSGMQVRLAFATAIQRVPDILLVDEVLAVGDMEFQQKCMDVFNQYKEQGVTLMFVSHDLSSVRKFCDKTILMIDGKMAAFGATGDVIDRYVYGSEQNGQQESTEEHTSDTVEGKKLGKKRWGNKEVEIITVKLYDKFDHENYQYKCGDMLKICISYLTGVPVHDPIFGIAIYSEDNTYYYGTNTDIGGLSLGTIEKDGSIEVVIPSIPFLSGRFLLTVAAHSRGHIPYDWHDRLCAFNVINTGSVSGIIDLKSQWAIKK